MSTIKVTSTLEYQINAPTSFIFNVAASMTPHQQVLEENLLLPPQTNYEWITLGEENSRGIRLEAQPGPFRIDYNARVELTPDIDTPNRAELSYQALPAEVLGYLNPSRYCESDQVGLLANKLFAQQAMGYARVEAICDWIYNHIDYTSGSTDASSTACDVLVSCAGVCRDFAHVGITFCRALGIPARYVSGYAVDLQPPDFHGFFEAFLGGKWYLFDATRLAPVNGLVRIGCGRDAADASFANIVGAASLTHMQVLATDEAASLDRQEGDAAVSTA